MRNSHSHSNSISNPSQVIQFWFEELQPSDWWKKSSTLDNMIRERFLETHNAASAGEFHQWRSDPEGALAEIIVLDQFSRNLYRDSPLAFAFDGMALVLAQEAIRRHQDEALEAKKRSFLYMPFMHSESRVIHSWAETLFGKTEKDRVEYEKLHKDIIDRFGRYPHRNQVLGRKSTLEEETFLKGPGSSF